jgi:hypothetical protein
MVMFRIMIVWMSVMRMPMRSRLMVSMIEMRRTAEMDVGARLILRQICSDTVGVSHGSAHNKERYQQNRNQTVHYQDPRSSDFSRQSELRIDCFEFPPVFTKDSQ